MTSALADVSGGGTMLIEKVDLRGVLVKPLGEILLPARNVSIADRIRASGLSCWDARFTESAFPIIRDPGPAKLFVAQLPVPVGREVSYEDIALWAKETNRTLCYFEEFLAVFPHVYTDTFPLFALGSLSPGGGFVPYAHMNKTPRYVGLHPLVSGWNMTHRILVRDNAPV